jgi:Ca2+/H+ antiporter
VQLLRQGEVAGYAFSTAPVLLAFVAACAIHNPTINMVGKYSDEVICVVCVFVFCLSHSNGSNNRIPTG